MQTILHINKLNSENTKLFLLKMLEHVSSNVFAYLCFFLTVFMFKQNYTIGINSDVSLPGHVYFIHYGQKPKLNDYVVFTHPTAFFSDQRKFLKIYAGREGDVISVRDRNVHINGLRVGYAKPKTRKGVPLTPIKETTIPYGKIFAVGTHKDSFDSRYTEYGLVDYQEIVGTAYVLF